MLTRQSCLSTRRERESKRAGAFFPKQSGPLFESLEKRELLSAVPEMTLLGCFDSGGVAPQALAVGDFNDDGIQDVVAANAGTTGNAGSTVGVLLGNGDGTFADASTFYTGGLGPDAVAVGDFNGDSTQDIAVANYWGGAVGVLFGNGDGTFMSPLTFSSGASGAGSIAVGDFNGDGSQDIAVGNYKPGAPSTASVLLGTGTGNFGGPTSFYFGGSFGPVSLAAGDFDGDGKQDIAAAHYYENYQLKTITVLEVNANGTFQSPTEQFASGGPGVRSIATGDFNGDGRQDLAVANVGGSDDSVGVLINTDTGGGTWTFEPVMTFASGGSALNRGGVAVGDFNGDDTPDIAVTNYDSGTVGILAGNGDGTLADVVTFGSGGSGPNALAVADFNGDASADVAVANDGTNTVGILLSGGAANAEPTAANDAYAMNEDGTLQVDAASGLLANDTDPDGDQLTAILVDEPANGTLALNSDGSFAYQPGADFNGTDSFTYKANDGEADSNVATVDITIDAVNDAPSAAGQTLSTYPDETVDITLVGGDVETAPNDLLFTVKSLPSFGVLMNAGTAVEVGDTFTSPTLTYVPAAESDATDVSFTFTVTDTGDGASPALESAPATVAIAIQQYSDVTVSDGVLKLGGTATADTITYAGGILTVNGVAVSTAGLTEVRIWTGDGDDTIDLSGLSIPTFVYAGGGDDTITGGSDNDIVLGGLGNDTVTGGSGHDFLIGGDGFDRLVGSAGNDVLASGSFGSDATLLSLQDLLAFWSDQVITTEEADATDALFELDDAKDVLTGSSGADWFIISTGDRITDLAGKLKADIKAGIGGWYGDNYVTFV